MEHLPRIPIEHPVPDFSEARATGGEAGWRLAGKQWDADHRISTKIIPKRMFGKNPDLTLENLYDLLHVYYWWDDKSIPIQAGIEEVLADLTKPQFKSITRAVHGRFPEYCDSAFRASTRPVCRELDGWRCFSHKYGFSSKSPVTEMADNFTTFFFRLDDEEDGPLVPELRLYTIRRLAEAGLTQIEADFSVQVLDSEEERRDASKHDDMKDLSRHMQAGGSFQSFIGTILPQLYIEDKALEIITEEFEDVPDDWRTWDVTKKLALAKRFIASDAARYELMNATYEWETFGIPPNYLYAMRPDEIFPGEV